MRQASKIIALVGLLGLLVFPVGATTESTQVEVSPISPLWEPDWSPVSVSSYDHPVVADSADIDGDGVDDPILLGLRSLYTFVGDQGDMDLRLVNLGNRFRDCDQPLAGNALASGDVNGDGLDDLVVGTRGYDIWIFLQQPEAGGFEATTSEPIDLPEEFNHLWLFDHTGDGLLDLLVPDRAGKNGWLTVYAGDGEGSFGNPRPVEGIGEITRDGEVDMSSSEPGLWILTHDGAWFLPQGSFAAEERITFGGKGIAIADFDEDGDTDVVISAVSLRIYWREAGEYIEEYHTLDSISFWLDHADIDGDGDEDLVSWAYGPLHIEPLYNDTSSFLEGGVYSAAYTPLQETLTGGSCEDLDGDGASEILTHSFYGRVGILTSMRGGSSPQLASGGFLLGEVDVAGDGAPEMLTETYGGELATLYDTGDGWFGVQVLPTETGDVDMPQVGMLQFAIPADLDGNGEDELILWATDKYGWDFLSGWMREGDDVWHAMWAADIQGEPAPRLIATDLNNDGRDELLFGDGMHISVNGLNNGALEQIDRIAWGDDVAPYTLAQLPWGERLVGFRSTFDSSDLLWLDADGVYDTGILFDDLSPLEVLAVDLDTDGIDELVFASLGLGYHDGFPYLTMYLSVVSVSQEGDWTLDDSWQLPGWPAESITYPYEGMCVVPGEDGEKRIALSITQGAYTNGGLAIVTLPSDDESEPIVEYRSVVCGPKLIHRSIDGRSILLSIPSTDPQVLRVIEVER